MQAVFFAAMSVINMRALQVRGAAALECRAAIDRLVDRRCGAGQADVSLMSGPMNLACLSASRWELLGRALPPACHHNTVQSPLLAGRLGLRLHQ